MDRREFIKLLSVLPPAGVAMKMRGRFGERDLLAAADTPNIIIVVFDALSALNMSLYGYSRRTTPNIDRFADQAVVFHRHYSAGNFTTPGTASMLTGVYPWRHRGLHIYGTVQRSFERQNLFSTFDGAGYDRIAYTHNDLANLLLYQFSSGLDNLKEVKELCLFYEKQLAAGPFKADHNSAFIGERAMVRGGAGSEHPTSLFYALLHQVWRTKNKNDRLQENRRQFPRGMPAETGSRLIFRLEEAVDWLQALLKQNEAPILGYFHFYPPHRPYNTRREFVDLFKDDWSPPQKPEHFFTKGHTQDELNHRRRLYDEYVSYADAEFGRLYDFMDRQGYLENSHLILTSDHGEMFERGILAHITPAMYEPVLRVPLIISRPGSTTRVDVHAPTSSVDLLPTLAVLGGVQVPEWTEGRILTPFSGALPDAGRHIFSVEAKENPILAPLNKASIALMKDEYKLIHYRGYEDLPDAYELYNVVADPEEMVDLYSKQTAVAEHMRHELKTRLDLENRPFK